MSLGTKPTGPVQSKLTVTGVLTGVQYSPPWQVGAQGLVSRFAALEPLTSVDVSPAEAMGANSNPAASGARTTASRNRLTGEGTLTFGRNKLICTSVGGKVGRRPSRWQG